MADTAARLVSALSDRYEIGEQIGRGGMATVYTAHDRKHNRTVAIKVLRPELGAALGTERFLREIQVAARLRHPHIIPLFDSGQIPATQDSAAVLYYIMPRIEGESLRTLIDRQGALPIPLALKIASQVADALEHAHKAGVIHRDIKPENILIESGHALVADFGISRALGALRQDTVANLTETGLTVGTPAYMSPEQIEGRPDINGKSDIYSLACVLYEMLSGKAPYSAPTPTAVAARHFIDPIPHIRQVRPEVPVAIEQALLQSMAKVPDDRTPTAEAFNESIREGVSGSVPALPHRRPRLVVLSLLTLLAVGGLYAFFQVSRRARPAVNSSTLAILPFTVQGPDTLQLSEGMVTLLGTKMDGAGDLRTVDGRALLSYLETENVGVLDPERARRIAQHFSAGMFILGEVVAFGSRLQVTARLYDQDENSEARTATEEGNISSVFEMVDRLATKLLAERIGGAGTPDQFAGVSTTSLPAFRAYLDGESAMRTGRFDEAVAAYQRSVAEDSNFVLGWYRLSVAGNWLTREDIVRRAAARAERLSSHLPERYQQLLRATTAFYNGDLVEAERMYRNITSNYPDDVEAWMQLGELLFHDSPREGRDVRDSREPWRRVMTYEPENLIPLMHLVRIAALDRNVPEVDSLVARIKSIRSRSGQTTAAARAEELEVAMIQAVAHRDSTAQRAAVEQLRGATTLTVAITTWDIASYSEDLAVANQVTSLLTDPSRPPAVRAGAFAWKGAHELGRGRWSAAVDELGRAQAIIPEIGISYRAYFRTAPFLVMPAESLAAERVNLNRITPSGPEVPTDASIHFTIHRGLFPHYRHYLQGLYAALLDDAAAGERAAVALEGLPGTDDQRKLARNLALGIRAELAVRHGDPNEAIRLLEQQDLRIPYFFRITSPFYGSVRERYRRAQLLEETGRLEEARTWYSTVDAQANIDTPFLAPSLVRRGRISERMGDSTGAARLYQRAVDLYGEAEPRLRSILEEARAGLQRLSPSR